MGSRGKGRVELEVKRGRLTRAVCAGVAGVERSRWAAGEAGQLRNGHGGSGVVFRIRT